MQKLRWTESSAQLSTLGVGHWTGVVVIFCFVFGNLAPVLATPEQAKGVKSSYLERTLCLVK